MGCHWNLAHLDTCEHRQRDQGRDVRSLWQLSVARVGRIGRHCQKKGQHVLAALGDTGKEGTGWALGWCA